MQKIKPAQPRARISEPIDAVTGRQELRIDMPAPRRWYLTALYCVWLPGWMIGAYFAISKIMTPTSSGPPPLFLIVWVTIWISAGMAAMLSFLWVTFGREEVRLTAEELHLERRIFRMRWARSFNRADISHLRVSPDPPPPWWQQGNADSYINPFQNRGTVAFDYGAKTYRFGSGIDEAEAFTVRDRLNRLLN